MRSESVATHQQSFVLPEDMPFKKVAADLGIDAKDLLGFNSHLYKGLQLSSVLAQGTRLHTNRPEHGQS